jgi:hypothetical protein
MVAPVIDLHQRISRDNPRRLLGGARNQKDAA